MKSNRLKICLPLLLVSISTLALAQSPRVVHVSGLSPAAQQEIVKHARQSYYSLRSAGLDGFQSTIKPNWEKVLKDQGVSDSTQLEAALRLLNGIHFTMLLDENGQITVNHRADTEPPNEQVRQGFEQIYGGIEQAVSGFFSTWSLFMLNSPFPEAGSAFQLEDMGSQYRLSYKEGVSDVVTLMSKDLVISEIKVTSPQFLSIIKPQVQKTANGFILTGYVGDYTPTSGPGVVHLQVKIEHNPVNGLQLPTSLIADSTMDGTPTHMELAFSEYQVKSH
ncbi:MAG TPA: hypothetical protein VFR24_06110 [Candidatus Angelobacter sp.]|nr:hypothetical protein [Candidatus Angelobacter sp.]